MPSLWQRFGLLNKVLSSEISGGIFPEIYSNLSRNLSKNFFHFICLIIIICFQVQHCKLMLKNKQVLDKQLTRSLCFNFTHCVKKNNLFLARLPEISAIGMKIIDVITSSLLLIFP